jgi:hypothetical protein
LRRKERIIFSPFLRCQSAGTHIDKTPPLPRIPDADHRFYPRFFGLTPETAYRFTPLRE